jgi:hypothetical protein
MRIGTVCALSLIVESVAQAKTSASESGTFEARQLSAACPVNMQCSSGRCARITCTSDAQCAGHCVNQECQESLGTCYTQIFYS